jgi:hypothetical protein
MPVVLSGTNGVTFPDSSLQAAAASPYVLKNRLINGDFRIDQRNAGASVTANDGVFPVDRFKFSMTQSSKGTGQQSTTAPTGFVNSLLFTSSSAYSVVAGDQFAIAQNIEGLNVSDLGWGTANAQTVTLSFWVRSSLTGTFGGALQNSGANRSYPFTYTISVANTWEQKTITIAGDTTGTWLTTNGIGIRVFISLGMGSTYSGTASAWAASNFQSATGATSVVGTNGATFYITGVQLEQNTSATPFERRLYGQEIINCQRYFWQIKGDGTVNNYAPIGSGMYTVATNARIYIKHPVAMRTNPTASYGGNITTIDAATGRNITAIAATFAGTETTMLDLTVSGATAGRGTVAYINTATTDFMTFSAEL